MTWQKKRTSFSICVVLLMPSHKGNAYLQMIMWNKDDIKASKEEQEEKETFYLSHWQPSILFFFLPTLVSYNYHLNRRIMNICMWWADRITSLSIPLFSSLSIPFYERLILRCVSYTHYEKLLLSFYTCIFLDGTSCLTR